MTKKLPAIMFMVALLGFVPINVQPAALESSGEVRFRGWRLDNYLKDGKSTEFWDQRLRLSLNWPATESVRIKARADILEGLWGENFLDATQTITVDKNTGAFKLVTTESDPPARQPISFDWAYLQFVWPGTPVQVSVGRQEVNWGTGFWVSADNRDRFQLAAKLDPVVIVFAYDKFAEVFLGHDQRDDQRGWAVGAVADAAGFKFGLLAAYLLDETRIRFPAGDLSYTAGDAFAKGRLGTALVQAEVVYGSGTLERGAMGDLDAGGLGGYAGLFLPVGPVLTFGLEGAYARGDNPKTANENEGFFSADYQGPYWSVIFYNNMDYPGYAKDPQTSSVDLDFSVRNAVSGKLSAVFAPVKNLNVTGAVLYAAADQAKTDVEKAIGWEFDVIAVYSVTENISVTAGFGYALLGDYWKTAQIAGSSGRKPDNPMGVLIALSTRF